MSHLNIIDAVIVLLYLVGCLMIGLYKSKRIRNIEDYTLGGRHFHDVVMIATIFATFISASNIIGTVGKIHVYGMFFAITRILSPLFWILMIKVYAVNIDQFRGKISVSDIMGDLYGKFGRWVTNIAAIFLTVVLVSAQSSAIGYLFNYFLGISYISGTICGVLVLVLYSSLGGVRAVAVTDVFQLCIFVIAIPIACAFAYQDVGGIDAIVEKTPPELLSINLDSSNILLFCSLIFYSMMPVTGSAFIQRFLMADSAKQLARAMKFSAIINLPLVLVICLIGFLIRIKSPEIDPNIAFINFISKYLSVGFKGFLIAGMLAVIMSTTDSWLNTASVLCAHDICKSIFPKLTANQELNIARVFAFGIGFFAIFINLLKKDVMELVWMAENFWQPLIFIPLAAGFLKFRTQPKSFVNAVLLSISFTLIGWYIDGSLATVSLLLGIFGSALGLFGTHFLYKFGKNSESPPKEIHKPEQAHKKLIPIFANFLRFWFDKLKSVLKLEPKEINSNNYIFSIFLIINYMMPLFVVSISGDIIRDSVLYLRIIAIVICIPLIFVEYLPHDFKRKYYSSYWHFSLLFCLPFIASYTVLVTHVSEFWLLNAVLSVVLLFMLVDWVRFVIMISVGFLLGFAFYGIITYRSYAVHIPSHDILLLLYLYMFLMLFMVIFVRSKENAQEKKVENIKLFGGAIAHEVNTPIAKTQMLAMTLSDILSSSSVTKSAHQGKELYNLILNEEEYKMVSRTLPDGLIRTTQEAKRVVDVLLLLLKHQSLEAKSRYSMYEIIKETIEEYNLEPDKKEEIIKFNPQSDFIFHGHKQYIKQVLINLLNNSFKYAGDKFQINIWMKGYCLHFRDNGKGIDPKHKDSLFKAFRPKSVKGNGIGLAFCNILINSMGGDIECESEVGKYTEFIIRLPEV